MGQSLLDRSRRAVRLTAAGEAALPYARAALAAVADIHVAVDELTQLVRGTVTIGTVTTHSVDIPSLLADFHAEHPSVEITLSTDSSDALIDKVRAGQLDTAIVSVGPDERPDGLDVEVVTDEAIAAAVSPTDELASRKTIRLKDLADRRLIALPVGAGIRRQFDAACARAGVTPRIAFEASTPLASPTWRSGASGWRSCPAPYRGIATACVRWRSSRNCGADSCWHGGRTAR